MNTIFLIIGGLSIVYSLPYANYEFKQKNKAGAIMIYIIALAALTTSVIQFLQ